MAGQRDDRPRYCNKEERRIQYQKAKTLLQSCLVGFPLAIIFTIVYAFKYSENVRQVFRTLRPNGKLKIDSLWVFSKIAGYLLMLATAAYCAWELVAFIRYQVDTLHYRYSLGIDSNGRCIKSGVDTTELSEGPLCHPGLSKSWNEHHKYVHGMMQRLVQGKNCKQGPLARQVNLSAAQEHLRVMLDVVQRRTGFWTTRAGAAKGAIKAAALVVTLLPVVYWTWLIKDYNTAYKVLPNAPIKELIPDARTCMNFALVCLASSVGVIVIAVIHSHVARAQTVASRNFDNFREIVARVLDCDSVPEVQRRLAPEYGSGRIDDVFNSSYASRQRDKTSARTLASIALVTTILVSVYILSSTNVLNVVRGVRRLQRGDMRSFAVTQSGGDGETGMDKSRFGAQLTRASQLIGSLSRAHALVWACIIILMSTGLTVNAWQDIVADD